MSHYPFRHIKYAFLGLLLALFCVSCGYDSYLVADSSASYEELFVAAHQVLSLYYMFRNVDKEDGVLETDWITTPNVESFGSERHRIQVQVTENSRGEGASVFVRVELEARESNQLTRGIPDWIPQGRDFEKEEIILQMILGSV